MSTKQNKHEQTVALFPWGKEKQNLRTQKKRKERTEGIAQWPPPQGHTLSPGVHPSSEGMSDSQKGGALTRPSE